MHYNLAQMKGLATKIAKNSQIGSVILLKGLLGVGKTAFAKFFINYFLPDINVTSPTFNLLNVYTVKTAKNFNNRFDLWHFDLYNLKSTRELYEIGIEEALSSGISIVEWPEILIPICSNNNPISIEIKFSDLTENSRIIIIS